MKKRMKRFKNRRTTSTAAILCMAALLFAVLLAGCSVQKETEAFGDQQQETWSEEMENSTALSEEPDDTDTIGNADNPEDTGDTGNPENPEDTSTALTLPILDEINSKVQIGTSGSSLIAVQAAVKLLEWGEHTGLDPRSRSLFLCHCKLSGANIPVWIRKKSGRWLLHGFRSKRTVTGRKLC